MSLVATGRPLAGRTVVITRARAQAGELRALLEAAGARVLPVPTIVIEPPASWAPLDRALGELDAFDWVVFTSINGVEATRARLQALGIPVARLVARRLAAIGPGTAGGLARLGRAPDVIPGEYVAEGLVAALRGAMGPGVRVLLPRAADTRDVLARELAAMGARVDEVAAYRTQPSAEGAGVLRAALERRTVDAVTFTSASTVRHFAALFPPEDLRRLMAGVLVACIGPITRARVEAVGLTPGVVAEEYTIAGLVHALAGHYASGGGAAPARV